MYLWYDPFNSALSYTHTYTLLLLYYFLYYYNILTCKKNFFHLSFSDSSFSICINDLSTIVQCVCLLLSGPSPSLYRSISLTLRLSPSSFPPVSVCPSAVCLFALCRADLLIGLGGCHGAAVVTELDLVSEATNVTFPNFWRFSCWYSFLHNSPSLVEDILFFLFPAFISLSHSLQKHK